MNVIPMTGTLTQQVEALISYATDQARRERRKYRVRGVRFRGRWYYEASPKGRWDL